MTINITVSGQVRDKRTNATLPNSTIVVEDISLRSVVGRNQTDGGGNYGVPVSLQTDQAGVAECRVTAFVDGYKRSSRNRETSGNINVDFNLEKP